VDYILGDVEIHVRNKRITERRLSASTVRYNI